MRRQERDSRVCGICGTDRPDGDSPPGWDYALVRSGDDPTYRWECPACQDKFMATATTTEVDRLRADNASLTAELAAMTSARDHMRCAAEAFEANSADAVAVWEALRELHRVIDQGSTVDEFSKAGDNAKAAIEGHAPKDAQVIAELRAALTASEAARERAEAITKDLAKALEREAMRDAGRSQG